MRLFMVTVAAMALLVGCGGGGEKEAPKEETTKEATKEATTEETVVGVDSAGTPQQAPPRDEAEAQADAIKRKAAQKAKDRTAPEYEVAQIRPGTAATDLSQAHAFVYVTSFGGQPYGQFVNGPALQEIADDLLAQNPEYEVMVATFYSGTEQRQDRLLGGRYSFKSPAVENEFWTDVNAALKGIAEDYK